MISSAWPMLRAARAARVRPGCVWVPWCWKTWLLLVDEIRRSFCNGVHHPWIVACVEGGEQKRTIQIGGRWGNRSMVEPLMGRAQRQFLPLSLSASCESTSGAHDTDCVHMCSHVYPSSIVRNGLRRCSSHDICEFSRHYNHTGMAYSMAAGGVNNVLLRQRPLFFDWLRLFIASVLLGCSELDSRASSRPGARCTVAAREVRFELRSFHGPTMAVAIAPR